MTITAANSVPSELSTDSGTVDHELQRTFTVPWLAESDSVNDTASDVMDYFRDTAGKPWIGNTFALGNGSYALAYVLDLSVRRLRENRKYWLVDVRYGPPPDRDGEGEPTTDPLAFRDEYEAGFVQFQEEATYGKVLDDLSAVGRPVNSEGPLINTAGTRFPFPVDRDNSHRVLRITKYLSSYDDNLYDQYQDAINSEEVEFNNTFYNYIATWEKYTAKVHDISGSFTISAQGTRYWRVTFEFHLNKDTWRFDLDNRGLHRRAIAGDPNGAGGVISFADLKDGEPRQRRIKDPGGQPVAEPMWLNMNGQPIRPEAPHNEDPIQIRYAIYDELPFAALGIP